MIKKRKGIMQQMEEANTKPYETLTEAKIMEIITELSTEQAKKDKRMFKVMQYCSGVGNTVIRDDISLSLCDDAECKSCRMYDIALDEELNKMFPKDESKKLLMDDVMFGHSMVKIEDEGMRRIDPMSPEANTVMMSKKEITDKYGDDLTEEQIKQLGI